jgi:membrane-bound serine protease (ClpP class)
MVRGRLSFLALLLTVALHLCSPYVRAATSGDVWLIEIEGVINPLTAQYLEQSLQGAADAQAHAVIVRLDTPGGLESSMREMTQAMLNSPIPVIVYVAPAGARAASAGMFITLAAHVAAMAPGTNIGAAHPVGLGGEVDPVMEEKVVNDAAALARGIAATRGRNAIWAEEAVRESVSITADEALERGVIDVVAVDLQDLLRKIDGRPVVTTAGEVVLQTADAQVVETPMNLPQKILQTIADPNIAYILFTVGVIGIIAELYNPGAMFPGIIGAISLILAFVAFGNLPVNWAGLLLIVLAIGLFIGEFITEGIGFLAFGGIVAFVLGSLMLYTPLTPASPSAPTLQVSLWIIGGLTITIVGFFTLVIRALARARSAPVATGFQGMIGSIGVAMSDLTPRGTARVSGEIWRAVAEGEPVHSGDEVQVVGINGLILRVRRYTGQ